MAFGVVALLVYADGNLTSKLGELLLASAGAVLVIAALSLGLGWVVARTTGKEMERGRALIDLEPGEVRLTHCLGSFLGKKAYRPGFLVVTDRRLLRVHGTFGGFRQGIIARRDEVRLVEHTRRRAMQGPLKAALLESQGMDCGLTISTTGGGRHFLVVDTMFLDRLFEWLQPQFPCSHRNDADLEERPELSEVAFEVHQDRTQRRKNLIAVAIPVGALLALGGLAVSAAGFLDHKAKAPAAWANNRWLSLSAKPSLKHQTVHVFEPPAWRQLPPAANAPRLPEPLTRLGSVVFFPRTKKDKETKQPIVARSFQVARGRGQTVLRETSSPPSNPKPGDRWVQGWEVLGDGSLTAEQALDLAERRLSGR